MYALSSLRGVVAIRVLHALCVSLVCSMLLDACGAKLVRNISTFNNIEWVGRGYDIYKGNPLATIGGDPGYRMPVYDLSSMGDNVPLTDDQRYNLPAGVNAYPAVSCKLDFETSVITSMSAYVDSIQVSASVSGKFGFFGGGSFSASADYQRVKSGTSSGSSAYTQSQAQCAVYKVDIQEGAPPPLTAFFVQQVGRAVNYIQYSSPTDWNGGWDMLIRQFGTHVASSVVMGARYGQQSEMTSSYLQSKSVTAIKASAELSVGSLLSASAMFASDQETAEEFSTSCTSQSLYTVGSAPPSDGEALTWVASAFQNPAPIQSDGWVPLGNMLARIPGMDPNYVNALNNYITSSYCTTLQPSGSTDCSPTISAWDDCFGGMFTTTVANGWSAVTNPLTRASSCPAGFAAIGLVTWGGPHKFLWCYNAAARCLTGSGGNTLFGGMYATFGGGCYTSNPNSGYCGCPGGLTAYTLAYDVNSNFYVYACLTTSFSAASPIGGSFMLSPQGQSQDVNNPWPSNSGSRTASCPGGFAPFLMYGPGIMTTINGQPAGNWYICLQNTQPFFQRYQVQPAKPTRSTPPYQSCPGGSCPRLDW